MRVGSYVIVISIPAPWESSGESPQDLYSYVGHIGLVVEVSGPLSDHSKGTAFVRFPFLYADDRTGQRNIEFEALALVSSPTFELPRVCVDETQPAEQETT